MSDDATPPEPLELDDVKLNLRVDGDDEDSRIAELIVAAREHVEDYTGLVLTPREVVETVPALARSILLSSWPIASKDDIAITYFDHSGAIQTIDPALWYAVLTAKPARIMSLRPNWGMSVGYPLFGFEYGRLHRHHRVDSAIITIQAGYATPDLIPAVVKQAMQLLVAHFYANRLAVEAGVRAAAIEMPLGVKDLLRRWRKRSV